MPAATEKGGLTANAPAGASQAGQAGRLAIVAGSGALPLRVAEAAGNVGRDVFIIGISGNADPGIEAWPHDWMGVGEGGKLFRLLAQHDCRDLVIIGGVRRPYFRELRLDWGAMRRLPRILAMMLGGDNHLLGTLVGMIEETGVRVVGAHEVAPELLLPAGNLGRRKPGRRDSADIALGREVLAALGPFDVGQAVVVDHGHVIAVEGVEGTDAMLARCADLREGRGIKGRGVLVKAAKPGQELRVDMPALGARTVEGARAAGLAGIAAAAGMTLVADAAEMARAADAGRLFVTGFMPDAD